MSGGSTKPNFIPGGRLVLHSGRSQQFRNNHKKRKEFVVNKRNWRWILQAIVALVVLICARPAEALNGHPREGVDFSYVRGSNPASSYVRVAKGVDINTPLLAEMLKTDPFSIRADNMTRTLALCKRLGDGYAMGPPPTSMRLADIERARRSEAMWEDCPKERRYVYLVPGEVVEITGRTHRSFDERMEILSGLESCTDAACVSRNLEKLGVKVEIGEAAHAATPIPAPTADNASPPETVQKPPVVSAPAETSSAPTNTAPETGWGWLLLAFAALMSGLAIGRGTAPKGDRLALRRELAETESSLDTMRAVLARVEKANGDLMDMNDRQRATIGKLVSERDAYETKANSVVATVRAEAVRLGLVVAENASAYESIVTMRDWFEARIAGVGTELAQKTRELNEALTRLYDIGTGLAQKTHELDGALTRLHGVETELAASRGKANAANAELQSITDERLRCAELYRALSDHDRRQIRLDNEITALAGRYAEAKGRFDHLENTDPAKAECLQQLQDVERRIGELEAERAEIVGYCEKSRTEFEELHERLAGFPFSAAALYEEAQRDRNDAAKALGETEARLAVADQKLAVADQMGAYLDRARTKLADDRGRLQVERADLDGLKADLTDRKTSIDHQGAVVRRFLTELLEALGKPPDTTFDELEKFGGVSGLLYLAQERVKEEEREAAGANVRCRQLSRDLEEAREESGRRIAALGGRVTELEGENAELTRKVNELMDSPSIESMDLRPSNIPPDLAALMEMGGDPASDVNASPKPQDAEAVLDHSHVREREPPFADVFRELRRVNTVPVDTLLEVEALDDFWALFGFLNRRIHVDIHRICGDNGQISRRTEDLLGAQKNVGILSRLTVKELPWFVKTFEPPYRSVTGRTLVPSAT